MVTRTASPEASTSHATVVQERPHPPTPTSILRRNAEGPSVDVMSLSTTDSQKKRKRASQDVTHTSDEPLSASLNEGDDVSEVMPKQKRRKKTKKSKDVIDDDEDAGTSTIEVTPQNAEAVSPHPPLQCTLTTSPSDAGRRDGPHDQEEAGEETKAQGPSSG